MEELTLRIVLEQPPVGVDFGLQKGRGSSYETIQKQRSKGGDLSFEFSVGVKPGPDFNGPFVHGSKGERFVYIDIGKAAGQADSIWSRRIKAPLHGILAEMIDPKTVLEARIPGTGKDGGPTCATVKSISWKSRRR